GADFDRKNGQDQLFQEHDFQRHSKIDSYNRIFSRRREGLKRKEHARDETLLSREGSFKVCMEQRKDMQKEDGVKVRRKKMGLCKTEIVKSQIVKVNQQNDGDECDVGICCDVENGPKPLGSNGLYKAPLQNI
ncbi:hypothetical protein Tco_0169948, partial [Tanacetum coccineum]